MYADRDLCSALLSSAVDFFGANTLAVILNVPESEVHRWVQGRVRPSPRHLLQVVDLMRPRASDRAPGSRAPARRVLVGTSPRAHREIARIVAGHPVDFVATLEEGEAALREHEYSHVVIGYFFAGSQMLEFVRQARRLRPAARVLGVKAAGGPLRPDVRTGLDAALVELGGEGFFDLSAGETPGTVAGAFDEILALA